jgi:transposase
MTLDSITKLFCKVDDFCKRFEPRWVKHLLASGAQIRQRARSMVLSEIMTILILFHMAYFRNFKHFYLSLLYHWRREFPGLPSYQRFVEWMPSALIPLGAYLRSRTGGCTGVSFVDSTPLRVCHNKRISRHKVFHGLAQRGKTTTGWFFGFKLHLIINDHGEILSFELTPGNTDDRAPLPSLTKRLFGKLFGDKGYLGVKTAQALWAKGVQLITGLRSNMKNRLLPFWDKLLLRRRFIIETITDQLKNISQIEHSRHRSFTNFVINLLCGLIAYSHRDKKPSIYTAAPHTMALQPV